MKDSDSKVTITAYLGDVFAHFNTLSWQNFKLQAITHTKKIQPNEIKLFKSCPESRIRV